jgi:hypothetical protein
MCSAERKPPLLLSLIKEKCPNCRKGNAFVNKSIFPLNKCLAVHKYCPVCGQQLQNEQNNGIGINYALTVMIIFLNVLWYWPIFGLSYKNNSFINFLFTSVAVALVLQPWLMRMSRMIYLYMFVRYGTGSLPDTKNE